MKISPVTMFHTPTSHEELMGWIEAHTGGEKTTALTAAMMAWNLAAKVTENDITQTAQKCHNIALAIDSNRGNEKFIAKAIIDEFELPEPPEAA